MSSFHKLVRDRIPEIIAAGGDTCTTGILDDDAYLAALNRKLDEELAEYHAADSEHALEELCDIVEVIHAIVIARGYSVEEMETARGAKAAERGGFSKKILLKEVKRREPESSRKENVLKASR